jgi:hypothetical protein
MPAWNRAANTVSTKDLPLKIQIFSHCLNDVGALYFAPDCCHFGRVFPIPNRMAWRSSSRAAEWDVFLRMQAGGHREMEFQADNDALFPVGDRHRWSSIMSRPIRDPSVFAASGLALAAVITPRFT